MSRKTLYAALFVPDFCLQAVLRHAPELRERPVALIAERTARGRILHCTEAAREAGVEPGMTPSQGQARCEDLEILSRSPDAERCARAAMLDCASAFSASVEDTSEGACTLDLQGIRNLEPLRFAESLLGRLARVNLTGQVGFAPNADLALLVARTLGGKNLAPADPLKAIHELPLSTLPFSRKMLEILEKWGIRTLGGFAALGKEALAERLGAEALPLFAQATGSISRPLRCIAPPESYEETMELEHEVETLEPLLFILRRLLEQIALRLESSYLVAADLTLRLGLSNGAEHRRTFKIPAPTARIEPLFRAMLTHLEHFSADQPIVSLRLTATPTRPARQQFGLFESALRDPNQFFETLARLIALLGTGRVGVPSLENTHRPDAFLLTESSDVFLRETSDPEEEDACDDATLEDESSRGPGFRRFRPPLPATVEICSKHAPARIASPALTGRTVRAHGPIRISGDWWDARRWSRWEWDVELEDGTLCRLCQERGRWSVEGIYD